MVHGNGSSYTCVLIVGHIRGKGIFTYGNVFLLLLFSIKERYMYGKERYMYGKERHVYGKE